MAAALAASFLNYKNTLVNFSFARMRKKYIEDNDEQDPELIRKVAPFYQRTSQILGGTQVAFVLYCGVLPSVFWAWCFSDAAFFYCSWERSLPGRWM